MSDKRMWERIGWEGVCALAEVVTVVAAVAAGLMALWEYREHHEDALHETAHRAYDRADENYRQFLAMCVDHAELDCYSGEALPTPALSPVDAKKQGALFTVLIDALEVAYTNYTDENYGKAAPEGYCQQWPPWVAEIRKYLRRPGFVTAWDQVGDEFDLHFQACVKALKEERRATLAEDLKAKIPVACQSRWVHCECDALPADVAGCPGCAAR